MRFASAIGAAVAAAAVAVVGGCAGSSTYVNLATGQQVSAYGPTDNPDLAACRADYQRVFAQAPSVHDGMIVPNCMNARGWVLQ